MLLSPIRALCKFFGQEGHRRLKTEGARTLMPISCFVVKISYFAVQWLLHGCDMVPLPAGYKCTGTILVHVIGTMTQLN